MSVYLSKEIHSILPNMALKNVMALNLFISEVKNRGLNSTQLRQINIHEKICKKACLRNDFEVIFFQKGDSIFILKVLQ